MANSIFDYESNAWMAVVTYQDLTSVFNQLDTKAYRDILQNDGGLTQLQAETFASRYRVDYQYADNITGFGATLFYDTVENCHVIAIRGTEPTTFKDILNDVFLGVAGVAYEQEVALERFYKNIISLNKIGENEIVDVTGHSLGGFLTQVFASKHDNMVHKAYTYNSPGLDGIWEDIASLFDSEDGFSNSKIINITAKDGMSLISDVGNDLDDIEVEFPGSSHSSLLLANTISFYGLLATIDQSLTIDQITQYYEIIDNPIENTIDNLKELFAVGNTTSSIGDAEIELRNYIIDNGYTNLIVDFLIEDSASSIASQAKGDNTVLYALLHMNPFAIVGNLPAYTNLNPDDYSDQFFEDRAQYLYYAIDPEGRYYNIDTSYFGAYDGVSWSLYDEDNKSTAIFGSNANNDIVIGAFTTSIDLDKTDNSFFGMDGDDLLWSGAGNDYLEGGKGKDTLVGGDGFDVYYADNGDGIYDSDGRGDVYFEKELLTGGTWISGRDNVKTYSGDGGIYTLFADGSLVFRKDGKDLHITGFNKDRNDLNIRLTGTPQNDPNNPTNSENDPNNPNGDVIITISSQSANEDAGSMNVLINLSEPLSNDIVINIETFDGSAKAGLDYSSFLSTIIIPAGSTSVDKKVYIVNDDEIELDETFNINVSSISYSGPEHVRVGSGGAETIIDDDKAVYVSVNSSQNLESDGGITFLVTISDELDSDITIQLNKYDESATSGEDYYGMSQYVTISAGQRTAEITVPLIDDNIIEDDETFKFTPTSFIYSGDKKIVLGSNGVGTIIDDDDPEVVRISISSSSAKEAAEYMEFNISLSKPLDKDITISTTLGSVFIEAGETSGYVYKTWSDDSVVEPDVTFTVGLTGYSYSGEMQIKLSGDASGTIIDDDKNPPPDTPLPPDPKPTDPLVLDINQDGLISTLSLKDSNVYFDMTGDGIKEQVAWLKPEDGFLAFDRNHNGIIDGINEVFGNETTSGFAELKEIDSNFDGMIDRKDALFNQLKIWQDINQDGVSQQNELKMLSELGIKNINLNVFATNINIGGRVMSSGF